MNKVREVANRVVLMTVLPSLFAICAVAQQSAITGQVQDSEGAAIAKARILVHWDSSGSRVGLTDNIGLPQDVTALSDASGHFSVRVPPGFYDLFVTAQAFTPVAAKVRVKSNAPAEFDVRLHADPKISKELAD
jgi:hypothetical protein